MLSGRVPQPPISRLTGMRLRSAGEGEAAFTLPLSPWLASPQGPISIGPLSIPADAAMACAIQTALPPETPFATAELSLRLLTPVHPGGTITAEGRLISVRRTLGLAEVSLRVEGRLVGHGSTLCFMTPLADGAIPPPSPEPPAGDGAGAAGEPAGDEDDPHRLPVRGEILPQEVWRTRPGREILEAQLEGALPPPPIHHLTGLTLTEVGEGRTRFTLPTSPWFTAPARRRVQGGLVATAAEAALSAAIQTRLPPEVVLAPVDLKVNYLRPLTADGRIAVATGEVIHLGRRVAVAQATVTDPDGRPVAVATGSALLLAGRQANLAGTAT
jgi:uncharacterized protein (TIGR00369 family)